MDAETCVSEPERMEEGEGSEHEEDEDKEEEEDFTVQVGDTYSCKRQDGTYHDAKVVKSRMNKRAGREEFFVHYVGLNCRQNEWVDKTRLLLVNPVEEEEEEEDEEEAEAGTNETVEEKSENGNASEKQKSDEEEPPPKKIKVDVHNPPVNSSLVASEDFAEELTCPLCIELFKDPVVVECGHNFCRSCFDEAWEGQDSFTCPDCKEVIKDKKYTSNRALANLVKKTATPAKSIAKEKPRLPENCLVHDERLKLFCKDDGDLGCVICRESLKHASHNFLPILDAVGVYRSELTSIVTPLEDALKMAEQMAKQQNEKIENHRTNMEEYEEHIKSEFKKLHQLLNEREETLLEKLQEEGSSMLMEMEANIARMQENISSIKESISLASDKLKNADAISFLTDIKSFIKKCEEQQKEALSSGNTLIDKELSRDTYMAPIQPTIWEAEDKIEKTPAPPKAKQIWIFGNVLVTWAFRRAKACSFGQNLGFEENIFTICWMGKAILQWRDVLMELRHTAAILGTPSIVILHLGGNDLDRLSGFKLINSVRRDFPKLREQYPNTIFVWSEVLPRTEWLTTPVEKKRKKFNGAAARVAEACGFSLLTHEEIEKRVCSHYRKQRGITDVELDIFNTTIKDFLTKAICKVK